MQASVATPDPPQSPVATPGSPGAPVTLQPTVINIRDVRARRSEISSQLANVTSRRKELAGQLRGAAPGVDRAGLESRIAVLDKRVVEMENDLATTGRLIQDAQGSAVTGEPPPLPGNVPNRDQVTAIAIVFTVVVLMPLSIAWARAIFRRAARQAEQPSQHLMTRLDRIEEGIETIAIEVERISEGQRFVTKVIGAAGAEPLPISRGERVEAER